MPFLLLPRQDTDTAAPPTSSPIATRPSESNNPTSTPSGTHISFWIWIIVALILLATLSFAVYFLYASLRARRHGLPQPSLNPFAHFSSSFNSRGGSGGGGRSRRSGGGGGGGVVTWIKDKFASISSSGGKGYQGPPGGRTRGTFGALDPDEAWDAVGAEADYGYGGNGTTGGGYEEQELGRVGKGYAQGGGLGSMETGRDDGERARKAERDLAARYDEEMHGGSGTRGKVQNPFDDDDEEEASLRGVSPRPEDEQGRGHRSQGSAGGRFREGV